MRPSRFIGPALAALASACAVWPAQAASPSREVAAGEAAAARLLADPASARFRRLSLHGDVVCGEMAGDGGAFRGFYAYREDPAWVGHAAKDTRSLQGGLQCFDAENRSGRPQAACAGYDFGFYFAYDHFCR